MQIAARRCLAFPLIKQPAGQSSHESVRKSCILSGLIPLSKNDCTR